MSKVVVTASVILIAGILGAAAFIYSGIFNVAATDPHWPVTYWTMEMVRTRSIKAHAAGIRVPDDLANHARVVAGTSHCADHCTMCHAAPGVDASDMADGMYPNPPKLTDAASRWSPGELFWILKYGIKMSGMPAWGDHSDDDLWNSVAFLEQLPKLSEQDYGKLVMESMAAGGHMMHGGMHTHGDIPGMAHGASDRNPVPETTTPQKDASPEHQSGGQGQPSDSPEP
jgi:hypothetical protein